MNWIDVLMIGLFERLWKMMGRKGNSNPFYFVIRNAVGSPYMVRYKLLRLPFFKVYLHHILRSDEDPELHDHPWNFVSLILWKGYVEIVPRGPRRMRPGSIVRHRAEDSHRLVLESPAWTLVFVTGKKRVWGFYADKGWMSYMDFLDRKYGKGNWGTSS